MISSMLLCSSAPVWVYESPTEMGSFGSFAATLPASNMATRLGAVVFWASMAAARGMPVPITAVLPSSSWRAAVHTISSSRL